MANTEASGVNAPVLDIFVLAREIRDQVYEHACDWNDGCLALKKYQKTWKAYLDNSSLPRPSWPELSTPTILLLNHQITSEAVEVLRKKPLVIDLFPVYQTVKPHISRLLGHQTLQHVSLLEVRVALEEVTYWTDRLHSFFHHLRRHGQGLKHLCISVGLSSDLTKCVISLGGNDLVSWRYGSSSYMRFMEPMDARDIFDKVSSPLISTIA